MYDENRVVFTLVHRMERESELCMDRFNLPGTWHDPEHEFAPGPPAPAAAAPVGGPWATAWRNYIKTVFKKGHFYTISCNPAVFVYIQENKTLAGKEDKDYEGEAVGRQMVVAPFERLAGNLLQRVSRSSSAMQGTLFSIAELAQTLGLGVVPPDPSEKAADLELRIEAHYQTLLITRWTCEAVEHAAGPHIYNILDEGQDAEAAVAWELPYELKTKVVLARCLQRHNELLPDETLEKAWALKWPDLWRRAQGHFPLPVPAAPAAPGAAPAALGRRGRGRGGGRGRGARAA